jgi:hypothetical protein
MIDLLQRYLASHLDDILGNTRLRLSKSSEFNDPFEFRYRHEGDYTKEVADKVLIRRIKSGELFPRFREAEEFKDWSDEQLFGHLMKNRAMVLEHMLNEMPETHKRQIDDVHKHSDDSMRVICFTQPIAKKPDEILLWSHYAASHTGVRIWLNITRTEYPLNRLYPIEYDSSPPTIKNEELDSEERYTEITRKALITKAPCWKYESEVRSFIPKPHFTTETISGIEHDFFNIPKDSIVRIDFGIKHDIEERDAIIAKYAHDGYKHVRWFQGILSYDKYEIEYLELTESSSTYKIYGE